MVKKKVNLSKSFQDFLHEMGLRAPDSKAIWQAAKTQENKEKAKKLIVALGKKKAVLRDDIAGFIRQIPLRDLKDIHKKAQSIHFAHIMLSWVADKRKSAKTKKRQMPVAPDPAPGAPSSGSPPEKANWAENR